MLDDDGDFGNGCDCDGLPVNTNTYSVLVSNVPGVEGSDNYSSMQGIEYVGGNVCMVSSTWVWQ